MKKIYLLWAAFALACCGVACGDDTDDAVLKLASRDARVALSAAGGEASLVVGPEGGTVRFEVVSSSNWEIAAMTEWCLPQLAAGKLALLLERFSGSAPSREGVVRIVNAQGAAATISIRQTSVEPAVVTLKGDTHRLPYEGGELVLSVESNRPRIDYEIIDAPVDWLTVEYDAGKGTFRLAAERNFTNRTLTATLLVTAGAGADLAEARWNVVQYNGSLILRYVILEAGTVIAVPLHGALECTIDWGDGETEELHTSVGKHPTHWYEAPGTYDIAVSGRVERLRTDGAARIADFLAEFVEWGDVGLVSLQGALAGTSVETVPQPDNDALAAVTDVSRMFEGCTRLKSVPAGLFDSAAAITDFSSLFSGCTALSGVSPATEIDGIRIRLWERVSRPERFAAPQRFAGAFAGCTRLDDWQEIPDAWK